MRNIIHISETLFCPRESAFAYFTEPVKLCEWLCENAVVELWLGGKYELYWDLDNPEQNSTIGCRITCLQKNELLGFDWKGPVQYAQCMNHVDPLTHVTLFLDAVSDSSCTVHLVHTGWRSGADWEEARAYFERVWAQALRCLKETTEKR